VSGARPAISETRRNADNFAPFIQIGGAAAWWIDADTSREALLRDQIREICEDPNTPGASAQIRQKPHKSAGIGTPPKTP
jgi:hypothetical protein